MTALEWSNRLSSGSMSSMSSTGEYTFTDLNGEACSPDFAAYARACGADGYAIGSPEELGSALDKALVARGPQCAFGIEQSNHISRG